MGSAWYRGDAGLSGRLSGHLKHLVVLAESLPHSLSDGGRRGVTGIVLMVRTPL